MNLTPQINAHGQAAFSGTLAGPDIGFSGPQAVWSEGSGPVDLVTRAMAAIPGTDPAVSFSDINNYIINDAGQSAVLGELNGIGYSIWIESLGVMSPVAIKGDAAPGTPAGVLFDKPGGTAYNSSIKGIAFSGNGEVTFQSTLTGTGVTSQNNTGIWTGESGSLRLVARAADPTPLAGLSFGSLVTSVATNDVGQAIFRSNLTGLGVDSANNQALWLDTSGTLQMIVRENDPAPGTGSGPLFAELTSSPVLNNAGEVSFNAHLRGTGTNSSNNRGIWAGSPGSLHLVVRQGDQPPGTAAGVVFRDLEFDPVLNGAGDVAFNAVATGPGIDSWGIWAEISGTLGLIALEGDAAPGTEPGVVFSRLLDDPVMNGMGQVAFIGEVDGDNVNGANDVGIWATDRDGELKLVLREGELLDVNDDPLIEDLRKINAIGLTVAAGGQDGRPTSFNDSGELAIALQFLDDGVYSQGVFVVSLFLPGDLNGDGFVGIADLNAILSHWNQSVTPGDLLSGDPSGDGFVGIEDLNEVLGNWNTGTPPSLAIPEPGTMGLLCVSLSLSGLTHRRRRAG